MSEQAQPPTVASLRVDKPGKSKFAPVISGERRKATPAAVETTPTQRTIVTPATPGEPINAESPINLGAGRRQTTIEAVAARRERRRSIILEEPLTPSSTFMSAATLPTLNFTASTSRVTMANFLRDSGMGVPMNNSPVIPATSSRGATAPKSPARLNVPRSVSTTIVPQVRIVNGNIVVDEDAVTISPSAVPEFPMDVVNESGRYLTSHSFVKTIGNNRWSRQDTDLFHEALSMCGTDFAMISLLFPKRSREQVKGKYKVEERTNPGRVANSLKRRRPLDTKWLEKCQVDKEDDTMERKPGRPKTQENLDNLFTTTFPAKSSPERSKRSSPVKSDPNTPTKGSKRPSPIKSDPDIFTKKNRRSSPIKSDPNTTPSKSNRGGSSPTNTSPRKSPRFTTPNKRR